MADTFRHEFTRETHEFSKSNPGKIDDYYNIQKKPLGEGSYGTVRLGTNKSTKAVRAIKEIMKSKMKAKDVEKFKTEVGIQQQLDHPNIVKLYESYSDHSCYYLVMESCSGGELFDRIVAATEEHEGQAFSEKQAATYMKQIVGAMHYLHSKHVAHRDIKPENFLMETTSKDAQIKVIDFGLAYKFTPGQKMKTKAGTPYYVSPEVLAGSYSEKCDVWSCGVIAFIILCGYPPFYGDNDYEILKNVKHESLKFPSPDWDATSKHAKDFIKKMVVRGEDSRPSFEEVMADVWLAEDFKSDAKADPEQIKLIGARIQDFKKRTKLQKVALSALAKELPDITELKAMFQTMDKDLSGTLSIDEIMRALKDAGVSVTDEMSKAVTSLDTDGSGSIDYTEFIAATVDKPEFTKESSIWAVFRMFDLDGDGKITRQELKQVVETSEEEAVNMIKSADLDGDGEITFEEFKTMLKNA